MNEKTVTIFGAFDGIHEGHLVFIKEAKNLGDKLVAVVARDEAINKLKGKNPIHDVTDRIKALLEVPEIDQVFLGDPEEGTYNVLKEIKPDIICLGYDQQGLFASIKSSIEHGILPEIELVYGKPYMEDTMHSSLLNQKDGN